MNDKTLIELVRDCTKELMPSDRHLLLRLIERLQAAEAAALERAAQVCDEYGDLMAAEKDSALLVGKVDLSNAMSGEPRAAGFLANAIRKLAAPVERGGE